ncbi:hypothetical protein KY285_031586 [Solanum tuberosum]|nr:hypothetical protein KY284_031375 [Solanum tuberosum]KAH0654117.1 hypothetical protein KY289_031795 [Solanum tuberosum]KAH0656704.1 hypothetical protein KY285_031586 [Solanum tuberosum]
MSSTLSSNSRGDLRSPLVCPETNPKKITMDEMLEKYCGEFGLWQLRHLVLTSLAWLLEGIHSMVMIFADREPDVALFDEPRWYNEPMFFGARLVGMDRWNGKFYDV